MKSIILLAPPASGKGTQAKLISKQYNLPHISIGDLIRASVNDDSETSKELKQQMKKGQLIDDTIIVNLLKNRLEKNDCQDGYILDGFPRNLNQVYIYDQMLKDLDKQLGHIILLEAPKEITKKRILGRKSCPNCGRVYNSFFEQTKPLVTDQCDDCSNVLISRDDDSEEVFEKRYETYLAETEPIIKYYRNKGVLKTVDSSMTPEKTFEQIQKIIEVAYD